MTKMIKRKIKKNNGFWEKKIVCIIEILIINNQIINNKINIKETIIQIYNNNGFNFKWINNIKFNNNYNNYHNYNVKMLKILIKIL